MRWIMGVVAVLTIGATGCALTMQELRLTEPKRQGTFSGDYRKIASCVRNGLEASVNGFLQDHELVLKSADPIAEIIGPSVALSGLSPLSLGVYITIQQQAPGIVSVAMRDDMFSQAEYIRVQAWDIIVGCGKSS